MNWNDLVAIVTDDIDKFLGSENACIMLSEWHILSWICLFVICRTIPRV